MAILQNLKVETIITNASNPRKHLSNIEELAQNISEVGLIQPIAVRAIGDNYRLICGHRRLLAVQSLGWHEIPANVFESDGSEDDWWMLSENLQRSDLTDSEKGDAIQGIRFSQSGKIGIVEIATKLGSSKSDVHRWLQAAGYPEEVKQMTKDGTVTDYAVSPIVSLSTPQEQIKTAEYIRDNDLGYKDAKATVEAIKELPLPIRSKLTDEPEYTVSHAVAECIVETEDEYYDGAVDYKTTKDTVIQCKHILSEQNIKALSAIDKVKLKGDLQLLKLRLDSVLATIDWV